MSGIRNGVQALVKQEESKALYVHCLAHNLNLCLQNASIKCKILRNVMYFIYHLIFTKRLEKEVTFNGGEVTSSF